MPPSARSAMPTLKTLAPANRACGRLVRAAHPGVALSNSATGENFPGFLVRTMFLVPIHDQSRIVLGVLALINRLDLHLQPIPFRPPCGYIQRTLASSAAIAIRNS